MSRTGALMEIGARIARGALWMVAWRVADRTLGLISTIVLARLLIPGDFGLVAMAMSVIAVLELLSAFSFDAALIQNQAAGKRLYDTAWTLALLSGAINAGLLVALAVPASHFYAEPRLEMVLYCLAATALIGGATNIGTVAFRKDLRLDKEFQFQVAKRMIMVVVTIGLAVLFRSYWALVVGTIVSSGLATTISYLMHPYRPRFSLDGWRELFGFSKWLLLTNFLNFLHNGSPSFIIGKVAGAGSLGLYNVAYEIASLPTTELVAPVTRATFPGYAKMSPDPEALLQMFVKITGVIALITVPIGVGIAATSDLIVGLALGPKWIDAAPMIAMLAFYGVLQALQANGGSVMMALGKVRALAWILGFQAAVLVPAMLWGAIEDGARGVATSILIAGLVLAPINLIGVFRAIGLRYTRFLDVVWRPVIGAAVMYAVVMLAQHQWRADGILAQLQQALVVVAAGAATYSVTVLALWKLSSSRPSAEDYLLDKLRIRRFMRRGGLL